MLLANCSIAIVGDSFRLTWDRTMASRALELLARLLENVVVEYCTQVVQNVLAFLYDHVTSRAILILAQLLIVLLFLAAFRYFSKNRRSQPPPSQIIQPSTWSNHQPVAFVPRASIYSRMLKNREETRSSMRLSNNKNNMSTIFEHSLERDLAARLVQSTTEDLAPAAQTVPAKKPVHTDKYDETLDEITWGCENDPEVEVKGDRGDADDKDDTDDSDSMISAEQSPFQPEIHTSSEVEFYMGSENNTTHMTDGREEPPELAERILSSFIYERKTERKNKRDAGETKKATRHKLREKDDSTVVHVNKPATRSRSDTLKKRTSKDTKQKVSKGVNTVSLVLPGSLSCVPGCTRVLQETQAATSPQEFLNLLENMTTSICQQLTRQAGEVVQSGHMSEELSSNTDDQNESDTCGSDPQDDQYEPNIGGLEPHFPGNRSESSLVCKRDSWIWFSPELRPSLEDFAARQRKFQSRDPRVAELADEIRRQERMNRDIERAAESLIDSSSPSTGRPQPPPPFLGVFNFSDPQGAIRTKVRHSQPRATPYPLDSRRQGVRLSPSLTNTASWKSRHSGHSEKRTPTSDLLESPLSSRIKLSRSSSPGRRSRRSYSSSPSPKRRKVNKKTVSPVSRRRRTSRTDRHSSMSGRPSSLSSRHSSMSSRRSSLSGRHSSLSGKRSVKKHPSPSRVSTKSESLSPEDQSPVCMSSVGLSPACLSPAASLPSVEDWLDSPLAPNVGMPLPSPGLLSPRFDSSISSPESEYNHQSHRPPVSLVVPSQHVLCPPASAGPEMSETTSPSSQTYNLISPSPGHLSLQQDKRHFKPEAGVTSPRRSRICAERVKSFWTCEDMIQSNLVTPKAREDVIRTDRSTRVISPSDFSPTKRTVTDRLTPLTISITPEWPDGGKPVKRSPQMTLSTGESESDSAYRDRSGGPDISYRQCVISKEVNTTVQRLLFDTEKSSSSHSPSSKSRMVPLDRTEVEDVTRQSREKEAARVPPLTSLTPAVSSENDGSKTSALSLDQAAEKQPDELKRNQEVRTPEQELQVAITNRSPESKAARSRSRSANQHINSQKCTNIYTPDYYLGKRVVMRQQREYNQTSESPVPYRGDLSRKGGSTRKSKFTKHRLSAAASKQKGSSSRFLASSARAQLRGSSPRRTARKAGTAALNSSTRSPKSCRGQRSGRVAASKRSSAARTLSPGAAQEANDSKESSRERSPRVNGGKKGINNSQWKSSRPPVGSRGTVKAANTSAANRSQTARNSQTPPAFYGRKDGTQSGSSKMLVTGSTNNSSSNLSFSSKTDSSGKQSPVLEKTSPCSFTDKTSPCCFTGKTIPCHFTDKTIPCHFTDKTSPYQFTDKTIPCHFQEKTIPCHFTDKTSLCQFTDKTIPCHFQEKTIPCHFTDKTSPCHFQEKTSPCYFNDKPHGDEHVVDTGSSDFATNTHIDVFHNSLLSADPRQPRGPVKRSADLIQRYTCGLSTTLTHPKLTFKETWIDQSNFPEGVLDLHLSPCVGTPISAGSIGEMVILNNSNQTIQDGDTRKYSPGSNLKTSPQQNCPLPALVLRPAPLSVCGAHDGDTGQHQANCDTTAINKTEIRETNTNTSFCPNILDIASAFKQVSNPDSGYDESMSERTNVPNDKLVSDTVNAACDESVSERANVDCSFPPSTSPGEDNSYPPCVSADEDTEATWPSSSPAPRSAQDAGTSWRSLSSCSEMSHSSDLAHMSNMSQHDSEEDTLPSLSDELLCSWGHADTLFTVSPHANSVFRGSRGMNLKDVCEGRPYDHSLARHSQVDVKVLSSFGRGANAETDNLKVSAPVYGASNRKAQESQVNRVSRAMGYTGPHKRSIIGGDGRVGASTPRVSRLPARVSGEVWPSKLRPLKREGDSAATSNVKFCYEAKRARDNLITSGSSSGSHHGTSIMPAPQRVATPQGQRVATPQGQRVATPQGQKIHSPQGPNTNRPAERKHGLASSSASGNSLSTMNRLDRSREANREMPRMDWSSANNSNVAGIDDVRLSHGAAALARRKHSSRQDRVTLNNFIVTEQRPGPTSRASSAWDDAEDQWLVDDSKTWTKSSTLSPPSYQDLGGIEEDDCPNLYNQRASYPPAGSDENRATHNQICSAGCENRALDTAMSTPYSAAMPWEGDSHHTNTTLPGFSIRERGTKQVAGYSYPDKYTTEWTGSCGVQEADQQSHGDMTMIRVHLLFPTCSSRTAKSQQDSSTNVVESSSYFQASSTEMKHEDGTAIAGPSLAQPFNISPQTRPQLSSLVPRSSDDEDGIRLACRLFVQSLVRDTTCNLVSIGASTLQESTVSGRKIQERLVGLVPGQVDTLSHYRWTGRNPRRSNNVFSRSKDVLRARLSKKNRPRQENRVVFACPRTGS